MAERLRLLIIDDDATVARALKRMLGAEYDVQLDLGAGAALERFSGGERFDAVLCDLMMPDISGMAFHARLAVLAPEQAARVIFLTGGAFTLEAQAFFGEVTNLRLDKPVNLGELRAAITQVVGSAIR